MFWTASRILLYLFRNWSLQFEQFQWIRCAGSKSVGDSIRELFALELLKGKFAFIFFWPSNKCSGDFLLISNPATITNSTLEKNIAKYYKMRKKDKSNALNLIYVEVVRFFSSNILWHSFNYVVDSAKHGLVVRKMFVTYLNGFWNCSSARRTRNWPWCGKRINWSPITRPTTSISWRGMSRFFSFIYL